MIQAAKFGQAEEAAEAIELTDEERVMEGKLRVQCSAVYTGRICSHLVCEYNAQARFLLGANGNTAFF